MWILEEREENEGLLFYEKLHSFSEIIRAIMVFTMPGSAVGGWFLGSYLLSAGKGWGRVFGILIALVIHWAVFACLDIGPKQELSSLKEEMLGKTEGIIRLHVI